MAESLTPNPYATPPASPPVLVSPPFTVLRGFGIVLAAAVVCGISGALLGLLLGLTVPSYYRSVFQGFENPDFIPWQVGFGLGLTQGIIVGTIVGAVVLLAVARSRSRAQAS